MEYSGSGTEGLSQEDCQELKVSFGYIMSSRRAWTVIKNLLQTKQRNTKDMMRGEKRARFLYP